MSEIKKPAANTMFLLFFVMMFFYLMPSTHYDLIKESSFCSNPHPIFCIKDMCMINFPQKTINFMCNTDLNWYFIGDYYIPSLSMDYFIRPWMFLPIVISDMF